MLFELCLSINPIRTLSPAVVVRCYLSQCEQSVRSCIGSYNLCIVPILPVLVIAEAICTVLHIGYLITLLNLKKQAVLIIIDQPSYMHRLPYFQE
jgi:hypothetical protein